MFALTVQIGHDRETEALSGDGEEDVGCGLPPHDVGLWARRGHGGEEEVEVVLAGELLDGGNVRAQTHQHLITGGFIYFSSLEGNSDSA